MKPLLDGAIAMGYLVAGLFFLRFWRDSRDRLFALFAAAFWALAVQRVWLTLTHSSFEEQSYLYGLRLLAYLLIMAAIVDKNRR